ncbi:MAG: 30S ribosomal protein S21 [Patescibacteria group bacterium]
MEIKRREGEPISAFLYRFSKKMQQSGILIEAKKRKRKARSISKFKRRLSAIHKERKKKEVSKARKMGTL